VTAAKAETAEGRKAALEHRDVVAEKKTPMGITFVRGAILQLRQKLAGGQRVSAVWDRGELYAKVLKEIGSMGAEDLVKADVRGLCREALLAQALEVNRDELPHR